MQRLCFWAENSVIRRAPWWAISPRTVWLMLAAKKCFVGCTGISPDIGMVTEMMSEVNLNQMMFQRVTGTTYILADSSKFGVRTGGVSCPPEKIENIITDVNAPAQMIRAAVPGNLGTWVYQVD